MASEIIVNTIKAPTSGANANKIIIGSGQELDASAGLITPAGHVIQVASQSFNPTVRQTTSTNMVDSGLSLGLTMSSASNNCLITVSGGHGYMGSGYADGLISTICRNGGTTTYSTANDLTGGAAFGMEQIYNAAALNTAGHSFAFLDTSVGTTTPVYRVFFRSRSGGLAIFHENNSSYINITLMEIAQ